MRTALLALVGLLLAGPAAAQKVSVKSATPNQGAQATINLDVVIAGSGFGPGAEAKFVLSGTDNVDGITVKGTRFVSSTQLVATIDIADTASLALFDIKVAVSGRSGKGTDLFKVNPKAIACVIPETDPAHFQLVGAFNSATGTGPKYSGYLGLSLGVGEAQIQMPSGSSVRTLVVFAGTLGSRLVEVFFVDPNTGGVLDGSSIGGAAAPQPHITLALPPYDPSPYGRSARDIAVADLNGDGVPDAVASDNANAVVAGLMSQLDVSGVVSYTVVPFPTPSTAGFSFGQALAIGELDGIPGLEIAVSQKDQSTKSVASPARIYVYRLGVSGSSFDLVYTMTPSLQSGDNFGNTIAVGDVTGDGRPDLIGDAQARDIGRVTDAGAVLVFQGSGAQPPYQFSSVPLVLTRATPLKGDLMGRAVVVGNSDSDPLGRLDVLALTGDNALLNATAPPMRGVVFRGLVEPGTKETSGDTFGPPTAALGNGWGNANGTLVADVNQDGLSDLVMTAASAAVTPTCEFAGTVYVFLGQPDDQGTFAGWQRRQLFAPPGVAGTGFGASVAAAAPWQLLFVGETGRTLDGVEYAGQIYVYRVF